MTPLLEHADRNHESFWEAHALTAISCASPCRTRASILSWLTGMRAWQGKVTKSYSRMLLVPERTWSWLESGEGPIAD
eukprot:4915916-Amphidinium_carterae.1